MTRQEEINIIIMKQLQLFHQQMFSLTNISKLQKKRTDDLAEIVVEIIKIIEKKS